jgi:hypothetical protein
MSSTSEFISLTLASEETASFDPNSFLLSTVG